MAIIYDMHIMYSPYIIWLMDTILENTGISYISQELLKVTDMRLDYGH